MTTIQRQSPQPVRMHSLTRRVAENYKIYLKMGFKKWYSAKSGYFISILIMEKYFLKKLWPGWLQSRTELTENFTTRNVKVRGEKRIQDCGWWRLNKQTEERRRRRQRINKILDWILDCLQLLNLTLEDTYNCFSHLPNQYCELGPNWLCGAQNSPGEIDET